MTARCRHYFDIREPGPTGRAKFRDQSGLEQWRTRLCSGAGSLALTPAPVARTKRHYNAMGSGEKGFSGEEKGRRKHGQHEET